MIKYVAEPNLPIQVSELVLGRKYADILEKSLKSFEIGIIKIPDNPFVDKRLSGHADLSVFHLGQNKLLAAPYIKGGRLEGELVKRGFIVNYADIAQSNEYPLDAQLNACALGDKLIANKSVCCADIINYFTIDVKSAMVAVKQGYSKCAVCVVDKNSIITADRGIAVSAATQGVDVLEISAGHVELEGFPYGFIGGASFKISSDKLAFTGRLDEHPDKKAIFSFLEKRNIKAVFLSDRPIFDIGSAIPITEK